MFELKKFTNSLFIPKEHYENGVVYIFLNNFNEVEMFPNMNMEKPNGIKYILHKVKDGCLLDNRIFNKYEEGYIFNDSSNNKVCSHNPVFIPIIEKVEE